VIVCAADHERRLADPPSLSPNVRNKIEIDLAHHAGQLLATTMSWTAVSIAPSPRPDRKAGLKPVSSTMRASAPRSLSIRHRNQSSAKRIGRISSMRSCAISGGGFGKGCARSSHAVASSSRTAWPELRARVAESTLPLRSMTKRT
jgi:hypothetical protein